MIDEWAREFGIAPQAIEALKRRIGMLDSSVASVNGMIGSEARQQDIVLLEAAHKRIRLFRNNSGAYQDKTGRLIRYGLANDSKQRNEIFKSPDLVGWRPRVVTPDMIGLVIGQACMREIKHEGWKYSDSPHERAQLAFLKLAIADGCDAAFATGAGTL